MRLEEKRGDDTEIATAAAHRPEEIGIFLSSRGDKAAVSQHHVDRQEIVDGEAALPRQMADAAAERKSADAGRGNDPRWNRKTECMRGMVDIPP